MASGSKGSYQFITAWGSYGTGNGQFNQPFGVAVDSSGNVYVADTENHRIQKFGPTSAAGVVTEKERLISQLKTGPAPTAQPATPDVSGQWKGSNGLVYDIKQEGDRFEWTVQGKEEKGVGVLKGHNISASWMGIVRTTPLGGKITAIDSTGKATQIDWDNGLRFYR